MASFPDDVYQYIQSKLHPSPPNLWQPIHQASIGNIQVYNLAEACYDVDPDFPFVADDHSKLPLKNGRLPLMRFGLCLLRLPNSVNVLLDAGIGPWLADVEKCSGHPVPERPPHPLPDILQSLNMTMDDIHFVILSHSHGDHVGWTGQFPNAIHVMHQKEYEFATYSGCPWQADALARLEPLEKEGRLRLLEGVDNITIDEEKCPQLSALLCRGHTPGHIAFRISDTSINPPQTAFYIGDALHFPTQVEDPGLVPRFDCCAWKSRPFLPFSDVEQTWTQAMRTNPKWHAKTSCEARKALLTRIANEEALLLSPHFPPPGIGVVELNDGHFTYTPVSLE